MVWALESLVNETSKPNMRSPRPLIFVLVHRLNIKIYCLQDNLSSAQTQGDDPSFNYTVLIDYSL